MNSFGHILTLTTFGESHGPAIGGVLCGMPAGLEVSPELIQAELDRRRPGASAYVSRRSEPDRVQILSGIFEGKTLGTPIGFIIPNQDARPADYESLRHIYRPGHADSTYDAKYGLRDFRGGGRASARETACRVVGGALAKQLLATSGITVSAWVSRIGRVSRNSPDEDFAPLLAEVDQARGEADSVGGMVTCRVTGMPAGLGEPVFGKLQAMLAQAMLSIPGAKGFDYGLPMEATAASRGSEYLDLTPESNNAGGIQGGISNGRDLLMRVAFRPTATLPRELPTTDDQGRPARVKVTGRHDPCIALRAAPVVESMAALTLADALLLSRLSRL